MSTEIEILRAIREEENAASRLSESKESKESTELDEAGSSDTLEAVDAEWRQLLKSHGKVIESLIKACIDVEPQGSILYQSLDEIFGMDDVGLVDKDTVDYFARALRYFVNLGVKSEELLKVYPEIKKKYTSLSKRYEKLAIDPTR